MKKVLLGVLLLLSAVVSSAQEDRDSLLTEAMNGDVNSMYMLGLDYFFADEPNEEKAFMWMKEAAERDNVDAQYALGYFYKNGVSVEPDSGVCRKWMQKSADGGCADAQVWIGTEIYNEATTTEEKAQAVEWFKKAADQDNATAWFNLGVCYENGFGVKADNYLACISYRRANKLGYDGAEEAYNNSIVNRLLSLKDFLNPEDETIEEDEETSETK